MVTHSESLAGALPFADQPVEKASSYRVLAHVGKTVLRPGGLALSTWAPKRAVLPGSDVVEFAPGLGVTASAITEVGPVSHVDVEHDPNAFACANAITSGAGCYANTDAAETDLPDESADVVIGEAMLSIQGEKAKQAIMSGTTRTLCPGGHYVIHELGMRPDSTTEEPAIEIRRTLVRAINVSARPLTVADWRRTPEEVGLVVEETRTAPIAFLKPGRVAVDEGVLGVLRIMCNVAWDKDLRERVMTMVRTFKKHD